MATEGFDETVGMTSYGLRDITIDTGVNVNGLIDQYNRKFLSKSPS